MAKWTPKSKLRGEMFTEEYVSQSMLDEERDVCRVTEKLYISSYKGANAVDKLKREGVQRVLSVGCDLKPLHPGHFEYLTINVDDAIFTDLLGHSIKGVEYIDRGNGGCLVHCEKGMSRSAFMVIAHGMMKRELSLADSFREVKESRDVVQPNHSFCRQLRFLEAILQLGPGVPCEGALYELYRAEYNMLKDSEFTFRDMNVRIDPSGYCEQATHTETEGLEGLFCVCSRVLASPLNFISPSVLEPPSWATPKVSTAVSCPDCGHHIGSLSATPDIDAVPSPLLPEISLILPTDSLLQFRPIKVKAGSNNTMES